MARACLSGVSLAAPFLACAFLPAQTPLTLAQALHQAGQTSVQASLAAQALNAAQGARAEAKARFLPEVELQAGHLNLSSDPARRSDSFTVGPIPYLGSIAVPALEQSVAPRSSWSSQITASYLLYDFGRRGLALDATRMKEAATGLRGRDEVGRAQAEVAARYLAVMHLQARSKVVEQSLKTLLHHLGDVKALLGEGLVARNDLLRTEVALRSMEDADSALESGLLSAREALGAAMGLEPSRSLLMPETLPPPPALAWDEDQVRARAVLENPGLKGLAAKAAAARFQTDLLGRDGAPLVVARLGHSYDQNPYLVHPSQFSVYLGVTWKPFDGGTRSARVSQARADEGAVRLELEEARRQAGNAAVGAFREFRQALRELETAQLDVDAATENLRIVNEQYLHTYARGTEVLDAETVLAQSRFRLAERLCRAYTLQAALLAVLGEDLEAFYATTPPGALT